MCIALISAGVTAASAIVGGIAGSNNASYQAQVARNNAVIANQNADYSRKAGQVQAQESGLKAAARAGAIKAAQASNGINVNTGSNVDVQVGDREKGLLDTQTVLHKADLQAYGYRTQATNYEAEARLRDRQADQAMAGGFLGAAGSLAGNKAVGGLFEGAGGAFGKLWGDDAYAGYNRVGLPGNVVS